MSTLYSLDPKVSSAYLRKEATVDENITRVGRGTPTGELLRRYWHPIACAKDVKDIPLAVRVLGEDLILFRVKDGKYGLLYPRCIHRGTSLLYGKVVDEGIRCCYHGWVFNVQGQCVEQPCEPSPRDCARYHQPFYPAMERYGLIFAYLGPLDKMPLLPSYDNLEELPPGFEVVADGTSLGGGGPPVIPCNWLQTHENVLDNWHVYILHSAIGTHKFHDLLTVVPKISWKTTDNGVIAISDRDLPDGRQMHRIVELIFPLVRNIMDPRLVRLGRVDNVAWTLPIDDTHTKIFTAHVWRKGFPYLDQRKYFAFNDKSWFDLTEEEHQRYPGDHEAQVGQGEITYHSEEHLVKSDIGVGMYRRQLRQALDAMSQGGDPLNSVVTLEPVKVKAGTFGLD